MALLGLRRMELSGSWEADVDGPEPAPLFAAFVSREEETVLERRRILSSPRQSSRSN